MDSTLVLLPSPLLGPAVWAPVGAELASRGYAVQTAGRADATPQTPDDVLQHLLSAVPADRDVVLVPHSNAGLYVPELVERRRVVGAVFVDAGLPPREGEVSLAPAELYSALEEKADHEAMVPPWTSWWAETDVARLFPSAEVRERVEREQHRLPLAYFAARLRVPSGWDTGLAGAYLAFGDTYTEDRQLAVLRRWPAAKLRGGHLHMLVDPLAVTRELQVLLMRIG